MAMALKSTAEKSQWFGTVMWQTLGGGARRVLSASAEIGTIGRAAAASVDRPHLSRASAFRRTPPA